MSSKKFPDEFLVPPSPFIGVQFGLADRIGVPEQRAQLTSIKAHRFGHKVPPLDAPRLIAKAR